MCVFLLLALVLSCGSTLAQTLEVQLQNETPSALATAARESGDARRGAILFHQVHIGCVKCHAVDGSNSSLGPNLSKLAEHKDAVDEHVVASILKPSAAIRKGYQSITLVMADGKTLNGLLVERSDQAVTFRDPAKNGERLTVFADDIDEVAENTLSIMPAGIVNQLSGRQQFLDLLRYVFEIRDGGLDVARKLQPPPGLIALKLPDYEKSVDHAGLIRALNEDAIERGKEIYERLCINCHGNKEKPGSLPTALRFAVGKFRNGSDPYRMYKTLTHGFGLMVPQTWMVPRQKYDVVHYIRESYVRTDNSSQYVAISDDYLAGLPKGDTLGPEPVEHAPWSDMNYGPSMINTFEIGTDGSNFAYKGIAVRLDAGPGGISKGSKWAIFDHDTMRFAAAWTRDKETDKALTQTSRADAANKKPKATGFINWQGIHFDGRHGTHPRIVGDLQFANPTGPGWAKPGTSSYKDVERVEGRDGRRYGPLPAEWAKYRGLHSIGDQTIIEYSVGQRQIFERPGHVDVSLSDEQTANVFTRTLTVAPGKHSAQMLVATHGDESAEFSLLIKNAALLKPSGGANRGDKASQFNGASYLQIEEADALDMTTSDFSVTATIKTASDGTIFCKANADGPWVANGKTFFIRGGKLCYDIGWVGAATSKQKIDDGKWHDVALVWDHKSGAVTFYVDHRKSAGQKLKPKAAVSGHVAKIGFSSGNFPAQSFFNGEIDKVAFWNRAISREEFEKLREKATKSALRNSKPVATWNLNADPIDGRIASSTGEKLPAELVVGSSPQRQKMIISGIIGGWDSDLVKNGSNRMCLDVPSAAEVRNMVVWTASVDAETDTAELSKLVARVADRVDVEDLRDTIKRGGQARWPEVIAATPVLGPQNGPFAVDYLTTPAANPWFARIRLTGHDFYDDGDRVAVCSWDGDVWLVSGLKTLNGAIATAELEWKRIASGLFQPLGLKIVAGDIYLTCRDQLVILRDRNNDGETDFYECFNNDHQVTEHFHEFAMGLQRDEAGNFYYAKSARHALKAVVPHHGTLLRVPSNGSHTDILATGFRAANGVCLNPDGSFIVTDQEGHWNPKNRINWVREGGFYGNMFGYHDVTDDSDEAMEAPLCWITNAFDRSPSELMWINNKAWGPLNGTLLNLSYGYGKVYVVPHESVEGQMQGGMCELPIPQFPTGTARGRISPHDHGLYLSGMFAWGSSQQSQEGGFYRLRCTGLPALLPVGLKASKDRLTIRFSDPLQPEAALDSSNYFVKVWSLKRTANYGSKHYDEHDLRVKTANISDSNRTVTLTVPKLAPTWCMEIKCRLKGADGDAFERVIHNTIHRVD